MKLFKKSRFVLSIMTEIIDDVCMQHTISVKSIWKSVMSEIRMEATAGSEVRQRSWAKRFEEPGWSGDTWNRNILLNLFWCASQKTTLTHWIIYSIYLPNLLVSPLSTLTCTILVFSMWVMWAKLLSCKWTWKCPDPWIKVRFSCQVEQMEW